MAEEREELISRPSQMDRAAVTGRTWTVAHQPRDTSVRRRASNHTTGVASVFMRPHWRRSRHPRGRQERMIVMFTEVSGVAPTKSRKVMAGRTGETEFTGY